MTHEHNHPPIVIDPSELTPGSVIVTHDVEANDNPIIATRRGVINAFSHSEGTEEGNLIAPIEYVLSGLALSLSQTLNLMIKQNDLAVHKVFVALSQERKGTDTKITREIIIDGHLHDEDREILLKAAENCPVQKIFGGAITIETVMA